MLGDLSSDLIGTNPVLPKIVDQNWLNVDIQKYDNYPSDNNPVRIVPKLSDLWNKSGESGINPGINLVPNMTDRSIMLANVTSSSSQIIKEAKKAMMAGIKGKDLSSHLKARFASKDIIAAKEDLVKLSEEQGLLGNVYIDASAFSSTKEAEQFIIQHRNRLAQDIVVNKDDLNINVISALASKFHKNVVSSVFYDKKLFDKYKNHLVASGKISSDVSINSKEDLRQAFLTEPIKTVAKKEEKKEKKNISPKDVQNILDALKSKNSSNNVTKSEEFSFHSAKPLIEFTAKLVSKGKTGKALKEILYKKFAAEDIKKSAKYLALVVSNKLDSNSISKLIKAEKISFRTGEELKRIGSEYPISNKPIYAREEIKKSPYIQGYFYSMSGKKSSSDEVVKRSIEALKKGTSVDSLSKVLIKKLGKEEGLKILTSSLNAFNSSGEAKANIYVKPEKKKLVADLEIKQTLPDPSTIKAQSDDYINIFKGAQNSIDIDNITKIESTEINDMFNMSGLDSVVE